MKNLPIIAASLLMVVCQNTPAYTADHGLSARSVEHTYSKVHQDNQTSLPVYQNTIAEISLGYEGAMLKGSIKLDNGVLLHVMDYNQRDDAAMTTWHQGDILKFRAEVDSDKGLLLSAKRWGKNKEKVEPYLVYDVTTDPKSALKIIEINEEGKIVKLSDESVWEFSWFNQFSTKKWEIGQSVIIQGLGKKNSYDFINLSAPASLNVACAKATFVI